MAVVAALAGGAAAVACSSETTSQPGSDAGGGSDAFVWDAKSNCGRPGDKGNSLGVGQFCVNISDCETNSKARLCTTFGDPENYFCTFRCSPDADPPNVCGESARCACNDKGSACGCFPTRCDGPPSDSGSDAAPDSTAPDGGADAAGDAPSDAPTG